MATLFFAIAAAALLNAGRLSIAKAAARTARIIRKGAARARCSFVR